MSGPISGSPSQQIQGDKLGELRDVSAAEQSGVKYECTAIINGKEVKISAKFAAATSRDDAKSAMEASLSKLAVIAEKLHLGKKNDGQITNSFTLYREAQNSPEIPVENYILSRKFTKTENSEKGSQYYTNDNIKDWFKTAQIVDRVAEEILERRSSSEEGAGSPPSHPAPVRTQKPPTRQAPTPPTQSPDSASADDQPVLTRTSPPVAPRPQPQRQGPAPRSIHVTLGNTPEEEEGNPYDLDNNTLYDRLDHSSTQQRLRTDASHYEEMTFPSDENDYDEIHSDGGYGDHDDPVPRVEEREHYTDPVVRRDPDDDGLYATARDGIPKPGDLYGGGDDGVVDPNYESAFEGVDNPVYAEPGDVGNESPKPSIPEDGVYSTVRHDGVLSGAIGNSTPLRTPLNTPKSPPNAGGVSNSFYFNEADNEGLYSEVSPKGSESLYTALENPPSSPVSDQQKSKKPWWKFWA